MAPAAHDEIWVWGRFRSRREHLFRANYTAPDGWWRPWSLCELAWGGEGCNSLETGTGRPRCWRCAFAAECVAVRA